MKKLIIIFLSICAFGNLSTAQSIDQILTEIENNNTNLSALRKASDAKKLENKTGLFLDNPEIEFHYLWGNPNSMGQRTDFSITQSFDFPNVYGHQKKISSLKNEQVELNYLKTLKELKLESRKILYQLIYLNALKELSLQRLEHAKSIASSYESKFKVGETNILEYNKSQLNLLNLKKEVENIEIERQELLGQLRSLNGGKTLAFEETEYSKVDLPADFEQWYQQAEELNPMLNWLKQEVELSERQVKLSQAQSLPKIQAGYMSEKIPGEQFQGLVIGVSIPMWQNKNTVKFAKANIQAMEGYSTDSKLKFYNDLKTLYEKVSVLESSVKDYESQLTKFQHIELLGKALNKGQITLIEYMLEQAIYYESQNNLLEMKRDLNLSLAELYQHW